MDAQWWWDEIETELFSDNPSRSRVIADIKQLLKALEDGDSLPNSIADLEE